MMRKLIKYLLGSKKFFSVKKYDAVELDQLIRLVDEAGGPANFDFGKELGGWLYEPKVRIDKNLDPLSGEYFNQMLSVYEEISGRKYVAEFCEDTDFELDSHLKANSPYGQIEPKNLALHYERLSRALRHLDLKAGSKVLDMGAGWGLSSEFLDHHGFEVTAVDINPKFIKLIRERNKIRKSNIEAVNSSFHDFNTTQKFDLILFYECFHHEPEPWRLIAGLKKLLNSGGSIVLVGEPIQNNWSSWGLRLDALSIYCIRKFGWFESGWTEVFLKSIFHGTGMSFSMIRTDDSLVGPIVIARLPTHRLTSGEILKSSYNSGWLTEGSAMISTGSSDLEVIAPDDTSRLELDIDNFRMKEIRLLIKSGSDILFKGMLHTGKNTISIAISPGNQKLNFIADTWSPQRDLKTADCRLISFHLNQISFK